MGIGKVKSVEIRGIDVELIDVEVDISAGLSSFNIVGLADTAIKESKERVRSAILNSNFEFPRKKITINLAPAYLKKEGSLLDLPIAIGIISASSKFRFNNLNEFVIVGELSLDGRVKPIKGAIAIADSLKNTGLKLILPQDNLNEAKIVKGIEIFGVSSLYQTVVFLLGEEDIKPASLSIEINLNDTKEDSILKEIKGQEFAKRALEISAGGFHNILFIGPPGVGKTLLAKSLIELLPPLSWEEMIQTTKIYSIYGRLPGNSLISKRPFRAPHHTISDVGLIGGGQNLQIGEITLAHNGVLFLDELCEFPRNLLEALRVPLEEQVVWISRAKYSVNLPARFLFAAATNPCPCGYFLSKKRECRCSPMQIQKYLSKISGPFLDRIDIQIEVGEIEIFTEQDTEVNIDKIKEEVMLAWEIQKRRFKDKPSGYYNSFMKIQEIKEYCKIDNETEEFLKQIMYNLNFSMRAYHKVLKLARTIADLKGKKNITKEDIAEAVNLRALDKDILSYLA